MQKPPTATFFGLFQVLDGAADVLPGGIGKIEIVIRWSLLGGLRDLAPVEIGHERPIARFGEPVGGLLDLIVEPPPFLDDDKAGRAWPALGVAR